MKFIKTKKRELILCALIIGLMSIACLFLYQPMMNFFKDPQALRMQLRSYGLLGQLIMIAIMCLQVVFVFLPGEIVEVMSGYLYGPLYGMLLCMIGTCIGSSLIYIFVKKLGVRFIDRLIGLDKWNEVKFLQNKEKLNIICFILFFIPGTPKDLLTYFIPLTDMKLTTFLFITTIARIPSIITSTIGGDAIGVENYFFAIIVFVITGIISIIGIYVYRKISQNKSISYHL